MKHFHRVCMLLCLAGCISARNQSVNAQQPDVAGLYVRAASWAETMAATRERVQAWHSQELARMKVKTGPWHCTGALPARGLADAVLPEEGRVDLQAKAEDGKPLWTARPEWTDGLVHGIITKDRNSVYLHRVLKAASPATLDLAIGNSDGLELWVNGAKLFSQDAERECAANQVMVQAPLHSGENSLLMKLFNKQGGCAFVFSIGRDPAPELWARVRADFPQETSWLEQDLPGRGCGQWFNLPETAAADRSMMAKVLHHAGIESAVLNDAMEKNTAKDTDTAGRLAAYAQARRVQQAAAALARVDFAALRLAIADLSQAASSYPAAQFEARLAEWEPQAPGLRDLLASDPEAGIARIGELIALQREILLSNPLLDFDELLIVKRGENNLGLPQNWQGNCAMSALGYDNEIAKLPYKAANAAAACVYRPANSEFVGDIDLHWDGGKMLFSMAGTHGRWQIWEVGMDGAGLRQVSPGEEPDVDNYDPCYLPNEQIIFGSTRCFQGIPCVGGGNTVANLCRMDADGQNARMLCFDQDHNWCPTLLNNGQVMFSRWEYSDTPHYFSRLLFHMNPDGTGQMEHYGSNSYWPNSIFYARPIPNHPTQLVAIVTGHHGVPRMGELVIFDPGRARFEADGAVQRIPGRGKPVEPVIADQLVDNSWPRFLHPYPLNDKYFLVSCKPTPDALWGLYLVDVFDNMLLLAETPGYALFEPLPLRKTERPPCVADKVKLDQRDGTVYLTNIYAGKGLAGVPHGSVKSLRVHAVHYTYPQMGGHINIGVEGPWDVHQILGTVPVEEDGSAMFKIPANTPVAVQPLDEQGRAMQIMRSWFVAMPGETLSCIGCHEKQNMAPPAATSYAARRAPSEITPWHGPARGFSFKRDVQPVLDKYCTGCHSGAERPDGTKLPDFSRKEKNGWSNFTPSYLELHPYVRRPGPESDYHLQKPLEFHASTSDLIQMLEKGHHGVQLDADAWDRLYTWIDLNVPDHGTWTEHRAIPGNFHQRRIEMMTKYANRPEDPEVIPAMDTAPVAFTAPAPAPQPPADVPAAEGWPFPDDEAQRRQQAAGPQTQRVVDLGDGVSMTFTLVPPGTYVIGGDGEQDEWPRNAVTIDKAFWLGATEVTNQQYAKFDPAHRSGFQDQHSKDHTTPGYPAEGPEEPVVRVTWAEAQKFCQWLGEKSGAAGSLPTEAQWEWACRAGHDTAFNYGGLDDDFSQRANLADASIKLLAVNGINPQPIDNPSKYEDFLPKDGRFNDGARIHNRAGAYQPNAWGLFDMHGNVAEWTLSTYKPYPYNAADGRDDGQPSGKKVVRGGSWQDRPKHARAAYRSAYEPWQPVYNVGFRVAIAAQ